MKTAIICPICEKPKKFSETYAMKLTDYRLKSSIDYTLPSPSKILPDSLFVTKKVRVCNGCTKKMGYKTKKATRVAKGGSHA